ncbi:MAG: hypothetical protein ACTSVI_05345 [Promethearchaeota archaeon]
MVKDIKDLLNQMDSKAKEPEEKEKKEETEESAESGRVACPKCGSINFTKHEDRTKVLYYHQGTPIYAKKGVCNQCGAEFPL